MSSSFCSLTVQPRRLWSLLRKISGAASILQDSCSLAWRSSIFTSIVPWLVSRWELGEWESAKKWRFNTSMGLMHWSAFKWNICLNRTHTRPNQDGFLSCWENSTSCGQSNFLEKKKTHLFWWSGSPALLLSKSPSFKDVVWCLALSACYKSRHIIESDAG